MKKHGDIGHISDSNSEPISSKDFSHAYDSSEYPLTQEDCKDESDTEQCTDSCEMPKYKCIKDVWALKIKSIVFDSDLASETGRETNGTATFTPEDDRYAPIELSAEFVHKHKPVAGGYYVVYKDGYQSFSPASAFEEGYILEQNVPLHISNPFEWLKQWVDSYHRENGGVNGSDFLEWVYAQPMTCG